MLCLDAEQSKMKKSSLRVKFTLTEMSMDNVASCGEPYREEHDGIHPQIYKAWCVVWFCPVGNNVGWKRIFPSIERMSKQLEN